MEDNRKFATFFADAPKGKKIGAVLSWIATVILLVAQMCIRDSGRGIKLSHSKSNQLP